MDYIVNNYIKNAVIPITSSMVVAPIIINSPSDYTLPLSYTGSSISWIATALHPNTYTIEL